ncbi:Ig domain-containing protein [Streptomyces sp. NPDC093589]|uniref:Ig domain-containing protein n=1 Tax=Streptomyces sp. NPDC093589 TaxID=3366043 RepID=UPI0038182D1E
MGIETFRSARFPTETDASKATPAAIRVNTQLMEDAVPADVVSVGTGERNQEALFSNPFKKGQEELVVIDTDSFLTYLQRTDTSGTGWTQSKIDDALPACSEVVAAVHPNGTVWAFASPVDTKKEWLALRLDFVKVEADQTERCKWVHVPDAIERISEGRPTGAVDSLNVSYSPDAGPCVFAGEGRPTITPFVAVTVFPRIPSGGEGNDTPWAWTRSGEQAYMERVVGGGYLAALSRAHRPHYVAYYLAPEQQGTGYTLRRIDWTGPDDSNTLTIDVGVKDFVGTWYVPNLPQDHPQGDVGCSYIGRDGLLYTYSGRPGEGPLYESVAGLNYEEATLWQDADGKLHVFGMVGDTLNILHQKGWRSPDGTPHGCIPEWTRAETEEGGTTVVTVGLHAMVTSYHIDRYPNYRPSELIKMEGMIPAESYCICTQDIVTSEWSIDKVRLPSDPEVFPHIVSHYAADVTLVDTVGSCVPNHLVSISAESLVEIQVDSLSYLVGPGQTVAVRTNILGKVCITMAARGITPPVVHINADGLESGAAVDFAAPLHDFLAGNSGLPSQKGRFGPEAMRDAETTDAKGNKAPLVKDWDAAPLQPGQVVDHCSTMYGQAAGDKTIKMRFDDDEDPQEIVGYVVQLWDSSRPSFQAFRTREEVEEYRSYRSSHPAYGGWWEDFTGWASDVWEGIKTGATEVFEILVEATVELLVKIGDVFVSLGEFVIETLEQAAHAVEALFQMIADAVMRVIDWLKSLFSLSDIWDTKVALEAATKSSLITLKSSLAQFSYVADGWFTAQTERVNQIFHDLEAQLGDTRVGDFGNKVPAASAPTGVSFEKDSLNSPQANWFLNRSMSQTGGTFVVLGASADDSIVEKLDRLMKDLSGTAAYTTLMSKVTALEDFFDSLFGTNTAPDAERSPFVSVLEVLRGIIVEILSALDAIVDQVMAFLIDTVGSIEGALNTKLDLGFVNTLYSWAWKQARPNETPEDLTVGGLLSLIGGFFITTIHKLVKGVDNPPFPGGTWPDVPLPTWDPRYVENQPTTWDPLVAVQLQESGLAQLIMATIAIPAGDFGGPYATYLYDVEEMQWPLYLINGFNCFTGLAGFVWGMPPIGGAEWTNGPALASWVVSGARFGLDTFFTIYGMSSDWLGKRSSLLRNVGEEIDKAQNIWEGSLAHFLCGIVSLGVKIWGLVVGKTGSNQMLFDLGCSSTAIGALPDFFQAIRAAALKYDRDWESLVLIVFGVSIADGVCVLTSGLISRVPAFIEEYNQPRINSTEANVATVGQAYRWEIDATIGTQPINQRPDSAPEKFSVSPALPAPFVLDATNGVITCNSVPAGQGDIEFTLTGKDGYAPPLSTSKTFTIKVNGTPSASE